MLEEKSVNVDYRTYTDSFRNAKGKKIHCYYWEPPGKPRALLLIAHGILDHTMMYEELAIEMVKRGFFVFAHDHAGHGQSEGRRADVVSVRLVAKDALQHIKKVQDKFPDVPLFLFGHSMGGAMSLLLGLEHKHNLKGVVAAAPALIPNSEAATFFRVTAAKFFNSILPLLPIAYADLTLTSRDPVQLEKMNSDPLRFHGYFRARNIAALLTGGEEVMKKKEFVDFPYLILHGDGDKLCHVKGSEMLHAASKSVDKSLVVYPGAYHSLFQEPADVSTDALRRTVLWLDDRA